MKKLLVFPLLFLVTLLMSQPNFKITDPGAIQWVKIYETDLTPDQVKDRLISSGHFDIAENNEKLYLSFSGLSADHKGAGFGKMQLPSYVVLNDLKGMATIDFKDGKYRVTISNIDLLQKKDSNTFITNDVSLTSSKGTKEDLEKFALVKKGNFAPTFNKKTSIVYDYTFDQVFTIEKVINDNW